MLIHELAHHQSRESRVDFVLELTRALFPLPWFVMALPRGPLYQLTSSREHACDALAVEKRLLSGWFVAAAVESMHWALYKLQMQLVAEIRLQFRAFAVQQMVGQEGAQLRRRLSLLQQSPRRKRAGFAAVPVILMLLVAYLLAPMPARTIVASFPPRLPFSDGVPHVKLDRIRQAFGLDRSWYGNDSYRSWLNQPNRLTTVDYQAAIDVSKLASQLNNMNLELPRIPYIPPKIEMPVIDIPVYTPPPAQSFEVPTIDYNFDPTVLEIPKYEPIDIPLDIGRYSLPADTPPPN